MDESQQGLLGLRDGADHPIISALAAAAQVRPSGWAVRDRYRSLSYPELLESSLAHAADLASSGLEPGDLVMLESTHDVTYLVAYFAALYVGLDIMPCDPTAGVPEIEREISRYGARARLLPDPEAIRCDLRPDIRLPRKQSSATGRGSASTERGRVLLPTSGTGGLPKRAIHRADRLLGNAAAHAESVGLTGDDTTLITLSPAFGYCHTSQILAHLLVGGRIAFPPRPALPRDLAAAMDAAAATNTTMVPHLLGSAMLRALAGVRSLRQLSIGGSTVDVQALEQIGSALPGAELIQTWGMTECGPRLTTWRAGRDPLRPGCVGLPVAGVAIESRSLANGSDIAGPGTAASGELYAHTPYAMLGYLDDAASDALVLPRADLVRTGDLGSVDTDGRVYIHGRLKNVIDVAGKKVSPEEIEAVVARLAEVEAVRVIGRQVPRRGQQPVATVVRKADSNLDADAVMAVVRENLAPHKWLREVEFVDRLETTTTGKIRRFGS